jgi:hypothetical protein
MGCSIHTACGVPNRSTQGDKAGPIHPTAHAATCCRDPSTGWARAARRRARTTVRTVGRAVVEALRELIVEDRILGTAVDDEPLGRGAVRRDLDLSRSPAKRHHAPRSCRRGKRDQRECRQRDERSRLRGACPHIGEFPWLLTMRSAPEGGKRRPCRPIFDRRVTGF